MNRLFFSALPTLSLSQSDEGLMLLQKHAAKAVMHQVPADRVPPVDGYTSGEGTGFRGGNCMGLPGGGMTVESSVQACTTACSNEPDCGGFEMPAPMLIPMPGQPADMPVQYACYYGCIDGAPYQSANVYSYYKTDRSTTTTTSSTLYIWKESFAGNCAPAWSEEKIKWCCANEPGFAGSEQFCPQPTTEAPGAVDDPHITSVHGDKFDVYKPGHHEFLVIPEGASPQNADLYVSGKVRKNGARENDLWIRQLRVQGKWVKDGPYEFKTSNLDFGKKKTALIRVGASKEWKAIDNTNLDSNIHLVSAVDKKAPETDFAQSVSKSLELKTGPVKVLIDWATSQKEGVDINHLDLHVKGLHSTHMKSMGGLLSGDIAALQLKK